MLDSLLNLAGALGGVALGWWFAQMDRKADESRRQKDAADKLAALRKTLREELVAALGIFLDKADIIDSAIAAVNAGGAIPGYHVRFPHSSYWSLMQALGLDLTVKERVLLHNIFERLRVADEFLEQHEAMLEMHILQKRPNPQQNIVSMLEAQKVSLTVAEKLIRDYLGGNVTDVSHAAEIAATLGQPSSTGPHG